MCKYDPNRLWHPTSTFQLSIFFRFFSENILRHLRQKTLRILKIPSEEKGKAIEKVAKKLKTSKNTIQKAKRIKKNDNKAL